MKTPKKCVLANVYRDKGGVLSDLKKGQERGEKLIFSPLLYQLSYPAKPAFRIQLHSPGSCKGEFVALRTLPGNVPTLPRLCYDGGGITAGSEPVAIPQKRILRHST
jgi:hypothetical protein